MGNDSGSFDREKNDLRNIWQSQPTEPSTMTLLLIRNKTRELHARTRGDLLRAIAAPVMVAVLGGFGLRFRDPVLQALYGFAIAWSLAGLYFLHRGMWSPAAPADAALNTGLEYYRREIERRRFLFQRVMQWGIGPVLLVIATWIFSAWKIGILNPATLPKAAPFLTLMVIWTGSVFFVRMRQQRELQREIEQLNEIERAK
jgi:hypothetical protein